MSQRWNQKQPSRIEVEAAFRRAYAVAWSRRPSRVSEDSFQSSATKWWRRITLGGFPSYLLDGDSISEDLLAWWLIESAKEFAVESEKRERRPQAYGFALVPDTNADGDPWEVADPRTAPLDESVVGRLDANETITRLGPVSEIDAVVRYRALDFSYGEIGNALGITPGAARVRMSRAADRLALKLECVS